MASPNRKKSTDVIVALMSELYPGTDNGTLTKSYLDNLTDKEYHELMLRLQKQEEVLPVTIPNFSGVHSTEEHFLKFGKKHHIEFFHRLKVTDPDTGLVYTTPLRYLLIRDRVNRLQQHQEDKASFPFDNNHVDELSGQVTNASKGARMSFPELNVLNGKGFKAFQAETVGIRGGNAGANRAFEDQIRKTGQGNIGLALEVGGSGTQSMYTLSNYFRSMMLGTTLDRK